MAYRSLLRFLVVAFAGVCGIRPSNLHFGDSAIEQELAAVTDARPVAALQAEEQRRAAAREGPDEVPLLTLDDVPDCDTENPEHVCDGIEDTFHDAKGEEGSHFTRLMASWRTGTAKTVIPYAQNRGYTLSFPYMNFVQGFPLPGARRSLWRWIKSLFGVRRSRGEAKWRPPVDGETMGIISYQTYAKEVLGKPFPYEFFDKYYTGRNVPSWEDNENHQTAVRMFDVAIGGARAAGTEPMELYRAMEPRLAFDHPALIKASWSGFSYLDAEDVKYASNGIWGIAVLEGLVEKYGSKGGEVLGPLMTDSVFSVHLTFDSDTELFNVDMTDLEGYTPIAGYAKMGGKASFKEENGALHMVSITYGGKTFTDFEDEQTATDFANSKRSGWRFAEGAFIASLLGMTNLVLHVKDLHLELAAAFQAITVDSFSANTNHPLRKFLDPFILRSVQATNDNFKLLFEYHAAEFSLAPLPVDEQLRLIDDFIRDKPLNLAKLDMEVFGEERNMKPEWSTRETMQNESTWGWRWHYRALEMQRLYDQLIDCRLSQHYDGDAAIAADELLQGWWRAMVQHVPSLARAMELNPEWAPEELTYDSLKRVLRVMLVWLSWIHEDVGHSAAAYVYNAVHTPMCVPEDGVGVPMFSWIFNAGAYRGFVFLERPALLDEPPSFWFDRERCTGFGWWRRCTAPSNDIGLVCLKGFQSGLRLLGDEDPAFSECGKTGFYSCVDRVETAVSS